MKKGDRFSYHGTNPAWHGSVWLFSHYNQQRHICCTPYDALAREVIAGLDVDLRQPDEDGTWNMFSEYYEEQGWVRVLPPTSLFDVEC